MKNRYLFTAGIICLFTAFLHLIGGQMDLVNPMLKSNLINQVKGELTGAWHIVTIVLFYSSWVILRPYHQGKYALLQFLAISFILYGVTFVGTSLYFGLLTPQFIVTTPIGVLILIGLAQLNKENVVHP